MSSLSPEAVGEPRRLALVPALAADPAVLSCGACGSELSLSVNPAVRRAEIAAFGEAHDGHGERMRFAVQMPVPGQRRGVDVPRIPGFVVSAAAMCGVEIAAALALRRPEWPFR